MNKKLFAIFFVGLFFSSVLSAEVISNYGLKAAFTRSKLEIKDFADFSTWRSGFNLALFFEHNLWDYLSVGSQIEYNQKGYLFEQVETNEIGTKIQDVSANTRLDYLSLPLFVKIKYPAQKFTPFISFGPRYDYLLNYHKGEFKFTEITITDNMADNFESHVFGGTLSAGVQIPTSHPYQVDIEFRYNFDTTDSAKEPVQYRIKNKSFDIWIGLEF